MDAALILQASIENRCRRMRPGRNQKANHSKLQTALTTAGTISRPLPWPGTAGTWVEIIPKGKTPRYYQIQPPAK